MRLYIGYVRVSTRHQQLSGLGLEAQKQMCREYVTSQGEAQLVTIFEEIESGANTKRLILQQALLACMKQKATLLIARLDRLSRNSAHINLLLEGKIPFVVVNMPHADTLTLRIMAALAQKERELIVQRIRDAKSLSKKPQDATFRHVLSSQEAERGRQTARERYEEQYLIIRTVAKHLRDTKGMNLQQICDHLNTHPELPRPPRATAWQVPAVCRLLSKK